MIPLARYRLNFRAQKPFSRRGFLGSAWRGALGHALKRTVCVTRQKECESCLLYRTCVYPYMFETPPPQDSELMRRYRSVPHPYVLQLPFPGIEHQPEREGITIGLTLIGKAQQQLPYLLHAMQQAGIHGIGPGRTALELVDVQQSSSAADSGWETIYRPEQVLQDQGLFVPAVPELGEKVRIRLLTPFRTKVSGHLLVPDKFDFSGFFSPLLRRISMLQSFHGESVAVADFKGLTEQSRSVKVSGKQLKWREWTRYSSRQGARMQMGGIAGEFHLETRQVEPFLEWLWVGQWTHNGKAATMGLGRYLMEAG